MLRQLKPNVWSAIHAYIYRQSVNELVTNNAKSQPGEKLKLYREGSETTRQKVQESACVTATLNIPGFQVNPPSITLNFYEDWHRFDFKVRCGLDMVGKASNGT
jgi:hypothetical protein